MFEFAEAKKYGVKLSVNRPFVEIVEKQSEESVLDFCYRVIECEFIDIVQPVEIEASYCMAVDDEGWLTMNPMPNIIASYLYGAHKHGGLIVGNAIIMRNVFDADGVYTEWLTATEALKIAVELDCKRPRIADQFETAIREGLFGVND